MARAHATVSAQRIFEVARGIVVAPEHIAQHAERSRDPTRARLGWRHRVAFGVWSQQLEQLQRAVDVAELADDVGEHRIGEHRIVLGYQRTHEVGSGEPLELGPCPIELSIRRVQARQQRTQLRVPRKRLQRRARGRRRILRRVPVRVAALRGV